ncbi:MAG: hypothetical protein AAFO91_19265, partial [Bacteroidota bacterium]
IFLQFLASFLNGFAFGEMVIEALRDGVALFCIRVGLGYEDRGNIASDEHLDQISGGTTTEKNCLQIREPTYKLGQLLDVHSDFKFVRFNTKVIVAFGPAKVHDGYPVLVVILLQEIEKILVGDIPFLDSLKGCFSEE